MHKINLRGFFAKRKTNQNKKIGAIVWCVSLPIGFYLFFTHFPLFSEKLSVFISAIVAKVGLLQLSAKLAVGQPVNHWVEAGGEEGHDVEAVLQLVVRFQLEHLLNGHQQRIGQREGEKGENYLQGKNDLKQKNSLLRKTNKSVKKMSYPKRALGNVALDAPLSQRLVLRVEHANLSKSVGRRRGHLRDVGDVASSVSTTTTTTTTTTTSIAISMAAKKGQNLFKNVKNLMKVS